MPGDPTMATFMSDASFAKRLLDNLSTAVLHVDEHLIVRYMNPAAEALLAISRSRAVDHPIIRLPD
jgi:two-component system nitrogen regulation sensor histidine kinase GlnL